jgi:hypothetical protein
MLLTSAMGIECSCSRVFNSAFGNGVYHQLHSALRLSEISKLPVGFDNTIN